MNISKDVARQALQAKGLRVTAPRLAVYRALADTDAPLSYTEVLDRLGETDWDATTVFRNLVKLRDAGIACVVSRAEGIDRYALAGSRNADRRLPHFFCDDCGRIAFLPELTASMSMEGPWGASILKATVQLRGECPDCLDSKTSPPTGT